jgi:hypothetical protein
LNTSIAPTAGQLAATRLAHWHHDAQPLLTVDTLRDWIDSMGLVLYTPRTQQFLVSAPSFAEAVLGAATPAPSLAELQQPRTLLARLVGEGSVVPLHLFGSPTGAGSETPDFLVSQSALPYIFTLRGDKGWKQPPVTSGATKVSPLALASFNLLSTKGRLTASELATELGNEVTEAAALRALTELWEHLRVLPVLQADGTATLWELTTTRYNKQLKSGANAGLPSALSALISLYLAQAILPTEEEIETFLSPLASRSRIREVVRALLGARQIETLVIDGKSHVYVPGELPVFAPVAEPVADDVDSQVVTTEGGTTGAPSTERIAKFIPSARKPFERRSRDDRGAQGRGFQDRDAPRRAPRQDSNSDRERRPFRRDDQRPRPSGDRPRPDFSRPWNEEKRDREARRPRSVEGSGSETRTPRPDREGRPPFRRDNDSQGRGDRSGRPPFRKFDAPRGKFSGPRSEGSGSSDASRPRPFKPRAEGSGGFDGPRGKFSRPRPEGSGSFDAPRRPRPQGAGGFDAPRRPRPQGSGGFDGPRGKFSRPGPEGSGSFDPPRRPRPQGSGSFDAPPRKFSRPEGTGGEFRPDRGGEDRPRRGSDAKRPFSSGKSFGGGKSSRPRPEGSSFSDAPRRSFSGSKPSFGDKPSGGRSFTGRKPGFGDKPGGAKKSFSDRKPFARTGESSSDRPRRPRPEGGPAGAGRKPFGKPSGKFAGKPKSSSGKPSGNEGPFDKFKGNKKPFGKRGAPARKPREDREE